MVTKESLERSFAALDRAKYQIQLKEASQLVATTDESGRIVLHRRGELFTVERVVMTRAEARQAIALLYEVLGIVPPKARKGRKK